MIFRYLLNMCRTPRGCDWIETATLVNRVNAYLSHPTWVRLD